MYAPVKNPGLGFVDTSAIAGQFVNAIKPQIGELVKAAINPAVEALKPKLPEIVDALAPPLEKYVKTRLYPNVVQPIIDQEMKRQGARVLGAAAVTGGVIAISVVAFVAYRRSKSRRTES